MRLYIYTVRQDRGQPRPCPHLQLPRPVAGIAGKTCTAHEEKTMTDAHTATFNETTTPLSAEDRLWIVLSHLSVLFGVGLLLPLVVYLVKRADSEAVAHHAREALNFHLSLLLYCIACGVLVFVIIGIPLLAMLAVGTFVLAIVAAIKGADNVPYRYPFTLRIVP
jgi:uncharacterized protein